MEIVKNKCSLCEKNEVLIKDDFISVQIQKAFFSINKNLFSKSFADELQLCVTCTYQVELSSEIVREYDETCNRNNLPSNKKCFFCEDKVDHLISVNENPNETLRKINVFLNAVNVKRDYNNLKACLRCLYNLHIWTEFRKRLFKKTHIPEADTVTNNNGRRTVKSSPTDPTDSKSSSKANTRRSVREKSEQNVQIQHESISSTSSEEKPEDVANNNINKRSSAKIATTRSRRSVRNNNNKKSNWHNYLNDKLKNNRTVNELLRQENLTLNMSKIKNDSKLLNSHPFVNIVASSQISIGSTSQIIVISDIEETPSEHKKPTKRLNLSLKKSSSSKSKRLKKLKLKFPLNSSTRSKQNSSSPSTSKDSIDNVSDAVETELSAQEISSDEQDNVNLMCNVCDKQFTVRCEYLAHILKHEKMEDVIVNVSRLSLPEQLNITELSPRRQLRKVLTSPDMINRLLSKWIGEHAVQSLEDDNEDGASKTVEKEEEKPAEERGEDEQVNLEKDEENGQKEIDSTRSMNEETEENVESESMVKTCDEETKSPEDTVRSERENEIKDKEEVEGRSGKEDQIEEISEGSGDKSDKVNVEDGDNTADASVDKNEDKIQEEHSKEESVEEKTDPVDAEVDNAITSSDQATEEQSQETESTDATEERRSESPKNEELAVEDGSPSENKDAVIIIDDDSSKRGRESDDESKSEKDEDAITEVAPEVTNNDEDNPKIIVADQEEDVVNTVDVSEREEEEESTAEQVKTDKPEQIDEFSNSEYVSPPVMTCEDLLNILENIDSETETSSESSPASKKRKRTREEDEQTPMRKRVRFAEDTEVFTGDETGKQVEKLVVNDEKEESDGEIISVE